ncbi:sulfotransferase [Rhodobacteraceae bacterium 2CG4]|uniref:Sulfotransferase n=1 Tax=Halovulum marinum TaxID=2662447 RepID=A0A6L5Z3K2_9RHOB|nr:sulfotransferase [Halovulum marinum]MSU90645.1 sulfotransferase [Halovulum marinum]
MAERYAIGLGGQKCASSWVHAVLAEHPAVNAAPGKELDFFSYHHDRGHDWYARRWRGPGLRFENSPSYLHDPRAPGRLRAFAPGARLIATLRDPVDRAFSHHLHEIARGHIRAQPFAPALRANPDYLEQGHYARHLSVWRQAFPPDRMLILLAEEIAAAPEAARVRMLRFLGLDPGPPPAMLAEARNVSDRARLPALRAGLRAGGAAMRAAGLSAPLAALKRGAPAKALMRWNDRPLRAEVPALSATERAALAQGFAADMAALAGMMGRDSLPWPSWQAVGRPASAVAHR